MLKHIYLVHSLPNEELNGREVALVARVAEPHPHLTYLRSEPRH